jgi:BlaI family penicillinase repressor
MKKLPRISEAEWQVMEVVWSGDAPMTANQIVDSLASGFNWSPQTVKSMLNRLVKKRALKFESKGNRYFYRPAVSRQACVRGESRSFLQRVFDGRVGPMLMHLVEDAKLTPQQIEELRRLLDSKGR